MALQSDDVRYRKRQFVGNKFPVVERKFSDELKATIFTNIRYRSTFAPLRPEPYLTKCGSDPVLC